MKAFKDFSVKMKLVVIIVGVSFGIVFTGFLILFINYTSVLKNDLKSNAIINARLVGQYCIVPLTFEYGQEAQDVLSKLTAFPDIMGACVYDRENHVFATFIRDKTIQTSWPAQVPKSEIAFFKEDRLHVFHPILYQDKRYGAIYLQVATESLKGQILHRLLFMLAVTSVLLVLSYILADKLHKPITGPIYDLADVAHKIAEKKDYSIRVEAKGKDEIGTLYNRFNYLCEQVETREKERDSAEKQIMNLNEDLELRIKKRTSDLQQLNKELLIAKEEAEDANRTKSEFLANMSHEIRTPLNAITGLMYLALQSNPSPQVHGYLIKIENAAHSLLRIINDILDFSKIEAGKLTIESEEFFLEDVLEKVSNIVSIQADEKQLEFIITIDDDVPQGLVGDPLRLEQILVNLAGNAVKFTEKGEVVINIGVIEKKWNKAFLGFSIKDTGIGLDDKHQKRLFKAFSQADTSTTRKFGGTGLGLVICKRLVNMMGGDITMESKLGIGSVFSFTAIFGRHNRKQKVSLLEENFKEMRALVVDDNQTARKNIRYILESFKFDVAEANTGIRALQIIQSSEKEAKPFDLVIMDWKMPLMDGLETARHIRNDLKLINIPVILMVTAYGREEVLKEAKEIGLDGYISKPISTSTLLDRIMDALGGKDDSRKEIRFEPRSPDIDITQIAGSKILVVEDNEFNRQVASELLQSIGLDVTLAENGKVALDLVQREEFHAILMDIQMPEMDGLTAARNIRKLGTKASTIPIIALTAHAMMGDRGKSLAAGMNDHVTKPLDPEELFITLLKWLMPKKKHDILKDGIVTDNSSRSGGNMALPDLPGIDVRAGVNRVGGKIDSFIKLAKKFSEGQSGIAEDITSAMEAGDKETAIRCAHTLKGAAGNLSAVELYRAAADLEKLLKENGDSDDWRIQTELISSLLNQVLSGIWSLGHTAEITDRSSTPDSQSRSEPDILDITKALVKMKHLLDENSFRAVKHLNTLYSLLQRTPVEEELDMLKKRLDNFDYQGAIDIVNKIGAVLKISLEED